MEADTKALVKLAVQLLKNYGHLSVADHQGAELGTALELLERALAREDTDWEELVGRFYHSLDGATAQNVNEFKAGVAGAQQDMFRAYRAVTGEKRNET